MSAESDLAIERRSSVTAVTTVAHPMTPEKGAKADDSAENIKRLAKAAAANPAQLPLFYALLEDHYRPCQEDEYKEQLKTLCNLVDSLILSLITTPETKGGIIEREFNRYKKYLDIIAPQTLGEYKLRIEQLQKTDQENSASIQANIELLLQKINAKIQEHQAKTKTWWLTIGKQAPTIFKASGIPEGWKNKLNADNIDALMARIEATKLSSLLPTFLIFATGVGHTNLIQFLLPLTDPRTKGTEIPRPPLDAPIKWHQTAMLQLGSQLAKGTFEVYKNLEGDEEYTSVRAKLEFDTEHGDDVIHTTYEKGTTLGSSSTAGRATITELYEDSDEDKDSSMDDTLIKRADSAEKRLLKIPQAQYEAVTVRRCRKPLEIAPLPGLESTPSRTIKEEQSIYKIRDLFLQRLQELNRTALHPIPRSLADDLEECSFRYLNQLDGESGQSRGIATTMIELSRNAKFFDYVGITTTEVGLMQAIPLIAGVRVAGSFGFRHMLYSFMFKDDGVIRGSRLLSEINNKLNARGYRLCQIGDVKQDEHGPYIEMQIQTLPEKKVKAPPPAYTRKILAITGGPK